MQFTLETDQIELEGTHQVIVCAREPIHRPPDSDGLLTYCLMRQGDRTCGALVQRIDSGDDSIAMDMYLRMFLQARPGDKISVEFTSFPVASRVDLLVPAETWSKELQQLIHDYLLDRPLTIGQSVLLWVAPLTGEPLVGEVTSITPNEVARMTLDTELVISTGKLHHGAISWDHIGGLSTEIQRIREIIEYPLRNPAAFQRLGISPPRGIILFGPPGTGKTLIAKALAQEVGATVLSIQGPEIISGWYGGSEQNLRDIFERARYKSPAIILIDELDSIAPRRERTQGEVEHRVVATLLSLMDGLSDLKDVVIIGTTNAVNSIDMALRRPGRFEHEIHIGVPDLQGRREILAIHTRHMPLADGIDLGSLAEKTYGFVGADLAALCRQAAYNALRQTSFISNAEAEPSGDLATLRVTQLDFERALNTIKPSAMREVMVEIPSDATWEKIGGLEETKRLLIENVVYGIQRRNAYDQVGIKPAKGILLYGPPGTGKTLLARATAREAGANFIAVRGPEVRSKWFGESEERVRFVFSKAREVAPCVILLDEIDAIAPIRGREATAHTDSIVNQLLTEMDGLERNEQVFIIATTNKSELIDPALLRPGRFDYQILVSLPDTKSRQGIFAVHLHDKPGGQELSLERLAALTDRCSGADISEICRLAVLDALRKNEFNPTGVRLTHEGIEAAIHNLRQNQAQLAKKEFGV